MDLLSILAGVTIGIVIGCVGALLWSNGRAAQQNKSVNRAEQELKTILAQQASRHIESSKESIDAIALRLEQLSSNIQQYEASLQVANEENDKASFFGEHAGLFLRNNKSNEVSNTKLNLTDAPPRDFANNGSGLFVGNIKQDKSANN